jgi:peptidoglycan/xylan/chitin deacetylase (PgdA/CDA1 family)
MTGALVLSLDFELHWGVRDLFPHPGPYSDNLLGGRAAVPRILELFSEFDVAATWATVGFLMAASRDELQAHHPAVRPRYADDRIDPYREPVGCSEDDDPAHYAESLVRLIGSAPHQEIGSHTYSHYYCLEAGAAVDSFRADMESAVSIATARNFRLRSLVLPRNQWDPAFATVLTELGFECYRGAQPGRIYAAATEQAQTPARRLARLADSCLPLTPWIGTPWEHIARGPLHDVPASCFLRPVGPRPGPWASLRLRRIMSGMGEAAKRGRVFHIWWHPHNFGTCTEANLAALRRILEHYRWLRDEFGMLSLSMLGAARRARLAATAVNCLA